MELIFLGTGAGRPVKERNVSAIALQISQSRNFWLFDCGEGTQHQLMRTAYKLSRLDNVFITHMHGDHTFGLPGLLSSRAFLGGEEPLQLFGPQGIREWVETALKLTATRITYDIHIQEIEEGVIFENEYYAVEAAKLNHRIESFGYRVTEKPRVGRLKAELLSAMGVVSGPMCGKLKNGEDIVLPDGRTVKAAEVTEPAVPGRVVTILGDTSPCDNALLISRDADILVHEATFNASLPEKALEYGHSTTLHAAETAQRAGAKQLILTHFSTRYSAEDLPPLVDEAKSIFPFTAAAYDMMVMPIRRTKPE
ncbi:ribonuclease Z [Paenibacillus abyssi]|uniref:Ribonuclease Z n=1 Tax=Paenibacillus abyssi TaxID=1340531 RepID=A0A917D6X7_9BACL|nr:ribonuclease Z [Paenibacillus abyssi]GGG13210.1 ribonuclease Z [Paenibacillus abyssi]